MIFEQKEFQISISFQKVIIQFPPNFLKIYFNYRKKKPNYLKLIPPKHPDLNPKTPKFLKHFFEDFFCFQQY